MNAPIDIQNNPSVFYFVTGEQLHDFGERIARLAVKDAESLWYQQRQAMFDKMFLKGEVAEIFRVSERTIDNWIADKIICPTKIGGVVKFEGAEIARVKEYFKVKNTINQLNN